MQITLSTNNQLNDLLPGVIIFLTVDRHEAPTIEGFTRKNGSLLLLGYER